MAETEQNSISFYNHYPEQGDSRRELLEGLTASRKSIDPKYFYDERGSELFDQITRLSEYYPSRTETAILSEHCEDIARRCGQGCVVIEPGSGSSEKVRLLLDEMAPAAYVPIDISELFLRRSAQRLADEYPWLEVHAVCADFADIWKLPRALPSGRRLVFYPGSTIGNMEPAKALSFLRRVSKLIGNDGGALIGVDLHKGEDVLEAAYNDEAGVTARFNANMLRHVNRVLNAEFEEQRFSHRAFYDRQRQRIEMHLVSRSEQSVRADGRQIQFQAGESIHTENSYKYTTEGFSSLASSAGLSLQKSWLDEKALFSVHYLEAAR